MITFRCSNESCEVGFPLKENTKEKVIACPIKECGKETNVWLKLKRIQVSWRQFFCFELVHNVNFLQDLKKLRREQVTKNVDNAEWREVIENLRYLGRCHISSHFQISSVISKSLEMRPKI